jgi:arylsulfatase A-like enzyme
MKKYNILIAGIPVLSGLFLNLSLKAEEHPNLVFVFPDQMRGQAMGFLGEEKVFTPVLDKFVKDGIYFSNAVSNYPVSSPTRAMLMTGQYPIKNKVVSNCTNKTALFGCELPHDIRCWSDVLKSKGYSLGYIGKWHLDSPHEPFVNTSNNQGDVKWNEWCPPERRHGFDYWHAYGTYDQHLRPMYWDTNASRDSFRYYDQWGPEHEADKAIDFIRNKNGKFRRTGQPFALVVSMNPPHTGYNLVPQKYKDLYKDIPVESLINKPSIDKQGTQWGDHYRKCIKDYYACISGVDEQFGRILKVLDDEGISRNTIVVFTADHGDCMGIHGEITKNNWYEESMRVPLIIRFPEQLKPRTDNIMLSTLDISPTLLGLMGFSSFIPVEVDGNNLADYLLSGKGNKPSTQWYMRIDREHNEFGLRGVRTNRYTFVINQPGDGKREILLFDRKTDPFQMKNIAGENQEQIKILTGELRKWLQKFNDPWLRKNLN